MRSFWCMYVNKSDTNCSDYLVQSACYHTLVQIVESLCTRYDVMHDTHTPTYWFRKYNLAVYPYRLLKIAHLHLRDEITTENLLECESDKKQRSANRYFNTVQDSIVCSWITVSNYGPWKQVSLSVYLFSAEANRLYQKVLAQLIRKGKLRMEMIQTSLLCMRALYCLVNGSDLNLPWKNEIYRPFYFMN